MNKQIDNKEQLNEYDLVDSDECLTDMRHLDPLTYLPDIAARLAGIDRSFASIANSLKKIANN